MQKTTCSCCGNPNDRLPQRRCRTCHNAYMRQWRPKHSELSPEQRRKANSRCHANVYQGRGHLVPQPCERCGSTEHIEKHHDDHSRPLAVRWLCRRHHKDHHLAMRAILVVLLLGVLFLPTPVAAQDATWGPPAPRSIEGPTRLRAAAVDAAWIGGTAALDLGVSRYGLSQCSRCYEGNPLMRSTGGALAMKLAATGAGVAWADHLRRKGDHRGAKIVRWSMVGLQVALAGNALAHAHR